MKLLDPIYGEFNVPDFILPLIKTPSFQRLRWVRLSNIASITYPMVADISRYAHSLGVCFLAKTLSDRLKFNEVHKKTIMCAGLLHDIGIPPMGHLMEEALAESGLKFDHEESIRILLLEDGYRFLQMPDGSDNGIINALGKIGISGADIFDTIKGEGDLGKYITSDIDLDNIDNVIRVFRSLFNSESGYDPISMVTGHFIKNDQIQSDLWRTTRKLVYEKLMFSIEDFAQKATMKRLLKKYIQFNLEKQNGEDFIKSIQFYNDDQMLVILSNFLKQNDYDLKFWSGENDRIIYHGWASSISKEAINTINTKLSIYNDNYYIDFIPDKRHKYSSRSAKPDQGALVGIFSDISKKGLSKYDNEVILFLKSILGNELNDNLPIDVDSKNQLSLFN